MPVDPWAATTAQEFTAQPSDNAKIAGLLTGWKGEMFDLRASVLANVSDIVADLTTQQATLTAQVAAIAAQNVQILALIGSEIYPDFGYASNNGYALPAGQSSRITRATASVSVPAGYTRALVTASAMDSGTNSTAGLDYLLSCVSISSGAYAYAPSATVPAGYGGASFASINRLLTGLVPGVPITFQSQPYTYTAAWAATGSNGTAVSATCLFLR